MQHVISRPAALSHQASVCSSCRRKLVILTRQHQRRWYIPAAERKHVSEYSLTTDQRVGPVKSIGIIGGGISGLATAHFIQERFKTTFWQVPKITIYESTDRLGGWLQTDHVDLLHGKGYVRIEKGPRTLAASGAGMMTMDLIHQLGIDDSVCWVKKNAAGAQNRYIYDGGDELRRVPTDTGAFIKDILEQGSLILPAAKHFFFNLFTKIDAIPPTSNVNLGDAMSHIMGRETVERLLSSFIHGIYAGNVWNLSPRAKGPWSPVLDRLSDKSMSLSQIWSDSRGGVPSAYWIGKEPGWLSQYQDSFVYYLKEGLGLLALALESELRMSSGTQIKTRAGVRKISVKDEIALIDYEQDGQSQTDEHDYVVSAVPPYIAKDILSPSPPWEDVQTVSVGTVTFFWKDKKPIPYDGFGYVISNQTPMDSNPHGALGVIFDSSTRPEQDTARGQKVTVLLGGEYWEPGVKQGMKLPSDEEIIAQAAETLHEQLGIDHAEIMSADYIDSNIAENCIPQPTVDFMKSVNTAANPAVVEWAALWNDRLLLTGPPVYGPGVHDCVNGAWLTAGRLLRTVDAHLFRDCNSDVFTQEQKLDIDERWRSAIPRNAQMFMLNANQITVMEQLTDKDTTPDAKPEDALWPKTNPEARLMDILRQPSYASVLTSNGGLIKPGTRSGAGSTWTGTPGSKD